MVAAAILCALLFGTSFGHDVLASVKLSMLDIANYLQSSSKDLDDYTTVVDSAVSNNGITIQLNEVILAKDEIIISTTIESDTNLGEVGYISMIGNVYINGKSLSSSTGAVSKQIDDYTMEDVSTYSLDEELQSGDLNIQLKYSSGLINGSEEVKGSWNFEFEANGDALSINTHMIDMDNTFVLENGQKITFNEYSSNAIGQKIYYLVEGKDKNEAYNLVLRGYDNLGNEVAFRTSNETMEDGVMQNENPISEGATTLTLILYAVDFPRESGNIGNNYKAVGEEFTIEIE